MAKTTTIWLAGNWLKLAILLVLVGGFVSIYFLFPNIINQFQFQGNTQFDILKSSDDCTIELDVRNACMRDTISGTITNGKNANCIVGINYNSGIWRELDVVKTNFIGTYTQSHTVYNAGEYIFAAICTYNDITCRTNNAYLTVTPCPGPGDSDGDGWSDDEEDAAGTDPDNPQSNPSGEVPDNIDDEDDETLTYTCGQGSDVDQCSGTCPSGYVCSGVYFPGDYDACACIDDFTVHPDWKPNGDYHNPMEQWEEPDDSLCVDSDGVDVFTFGTTTYLGISYPDSCHVGWSYAVDEYVCIDDVAVKKEIQCPNTDCMNGKCTVGTTTVYNQCLNLGYANGGGCYSGVYPNTHPELDVFCGDLSPLNHAVCFN